MSALVLSDVTCKALLICISTQVPPLKATEGLATCVFIVEVKRISKRRSVLLFVMECMFH